MSDELDRTAASMRRLIVAEHPSAETTLAAYVRGTLDAGEREVVDEHLAGCDTCREDVEDLRKIQAEIDRARRSRTVRWSLIAAAVAGIVILALTFVRKPHDDGYARSK